MPPAKQPWFRFYVEATTDRKLRRLTPAQRWLWVAVLAAGKQSPRAGWLMLTERERFTTEDLADLAGMRGKDVDEGLARMSELGLLEEDDTVGALRIVAWAKRQYDSDDVTARTRKHRSGNGHEPDPPSNDGTLHQRSGNGEGTFRERQWNGPDTDTETETEPPPPTPSTSPVADPGSDGGGDVLERACTVLAVREADSLGGQIRSRSGWVRARTRALTIEHADEAARVLRNDPDLAFDRLARYLAGEHNVVDLKPWQACGQGECDEGWIAHVDDKGGTFLTACSCRSGS